MKIKVNVQAVSLNTAYPSKRTGGRYLTTKGSNYKTLVAWEGRSVCSEPTSEKIAMKYTFGFSDKRRRDVDDYIKLTQDALTGIWYLDDKQISEIHAYKVYSEQPFVEIELLKL